MLEDLLPRRVDNAYRGRRIALWLFALLVLLRTAMSLNIIFNGRYVATSADGIPLDAFPHAAAQTAVSLFALVGFGQLIFCLLCALVLVRYRGMVPLMFALFLLEHLGRRLLLLLLPIPRVGAPPGFYVNLTLLAIMLAGTALSLWRRTGVRTQG